MTALLIIGGIIWLAAMIIVLVKPPSGNPIGPACLAMEEEQTKHHAAKH